MDAEFDVEKWSSLYYELQFLAEVFFFCFIIKRADNFSRRSVFFFTELNNVFFFGGVCVCVCVDRSSRFAKKKNRRKT